MSQPAGFTPEAGGISLPAGLTYTPTGFVGPAPDILEGTIIASYRALRNDLAASLTTYNKLSELQAAFGVDQNSSESFGLRFVYPVAEHCNFSEWAWS